MEDVYNNALNTLYNGTLDKLPKLDSPTLWMFLAGTAVAAVILLLIIKPILSFYKLVFLLIFVFYVAYILTVTFSGDFNDVTGGTNTVLFDTINRYQFGSRQFFNNVVGNVLMMIPYGMFLGVFLHREKIRFTMVIVALLLICAAPVLIEFGQHQVGRVFDIDDVVLNIAGGLIGYICYCLIHGLYRLLPPIFHSKIVLNILSILLLIGIVTGLQYIGIITN